jgi:outer membrane receptor protein involved in Fe transport
MNKLFRTALVLAFLACASSLLIVTASAQSVYGSIFGTVSDKSGAVIPNALITVTDEAKGTVVTVTSNGSGDYSVPHLISDVYDLKVVAKGFKPFETKGITVQVDTAPRIDPTLDVGSDTGTTVEVNAESVPLLKTEKADVSTVFDQQQVSSLPISDQNFTSLQLLLPGAQILGWSHASDENPQGSKQIQVDGQAFGGTAFELDGTDNQDPILGIIVINPATDAVTETKITTQNYDAELGKAVSAVMTAQTRSGTNQFHGSAYDWRTGNANVARDPYTQAPESITRAKGLPNSVPPGLKNRFGGSIGGPIWRDKAFFFGNYEGQRQKVGVSNTDTVPTAQMVSTCLGTTIGPSGIPGCDFSDYAAEYAALGKLTGQMLHNNTGNPAYDAAFAANVIPAALVSPQAQALLTIMKPYVPNQASTGITSIENNYSASGTGLFNSDSWTERGDWTINEKMHLFERFSRFTDLLSGKVMFGEAGGPGFGLGAPPYGGNSNGANDSLATGMDIAISPKLLTDFRIGYYRYNIVDTKFDQGVEFANQLGIPGINLGDFFTSGAPGFEINAPFGGATSLIGGGLGINRCNCPLTEREDQGQIVNNWTFIKGNHTVKVGADLRYARNLRVPSDTDRAGQMNFQTGPTSSAGSNGLGWATFALGDVPSFGRYVGNVAAGETNAKEFQKRTFFYGQDTWRVNKNLTLNLGLRWEIYFPESVNGVEHGSLMNLQDGYMHVAGLGQIPSDMGWTVEKRKGLDPRIGLMYQVDDKTVIRAGYGRSFDTGVFGSIFGHVVTQNLPVLGAQSLNEPGGSVASEFNLAQGPPGFVFPSVPSTGLLPAQAYQVSPKARPVPLNFPTIDAWNLSVQRAITPTLSITAAYVGNKGTHTLGDTDQNNTNPNEGALSLPGSFSVTGQTLNWDPSGPSGVLPAGYSGGVSNGSYLTRYYGGSLAACRDANYIGAAGLAAPPYNELNLSPGMCGWTQGISYYGDDQNTEFNALQVTMAKQYSKGLAITGNYQWASAWGDQNTYWTWDHHVTHLRDSNVRAQQLTVYGSYDLPFGKGKQFAPNANGVENAIIGGWQLSEVLNWAGGLPFSVGYSNFGGTEDCNHSTGGTAAPCRPNTTGRLKTNLTSPVVNSGGTISRSYWTPQPKTGGTFSWPGLDNIGNAGANTYRGPSFFNTDLAITKAVTIHEKIEAKFRMDAFNAFNVINAPNPNNSDIFGNGNISGGEAPGGAPRQLEFSLHVQF